MERPWTLRTHEEGPGSDGRTRRWQREDGREQDIAPVATMYEHFSCIGPGTKEGHWVNPRIREGRCICFRKKEKHQVDHGVKEERSI